MKTVNNQIIEKIDNYIEENKNNILEDLMELVRVPSVEGEPTADAPFGEGNKKMLEVTAALYERNGFKTRTDKENYYTLAFYGEESNKSIGIMSHGDVVPADGEWIICPPFEPIIKDGYMFGRGCNDDKSGIVETIYAAKMIRDLNLPFKSRLVMYTGTNEETGMADIRKFVENEPMPDLSIVPDGDYPYYGGERNTVRYFITSENTFEAIKSFRGGEVANIVLAEVRAEITYSPTLWAEIEALRKANDAIKAQLDGDTIFITAIGRAAHTGAVDKGINAAKLLADALITCKALPENDKAILSDVSRFICDGHGKGFGIDYTDTLFGRLICSNGIARTENGKLSLSFDIRSGFELPMDDIKEAIISACDNTWTAEFSRCSKGYIVDNASPFAKSILETYESVTGIHGKKPHLISGGTYARELKNAFPIGTINHDIEEPIDLPVGHGAYHGPDEKLSVKGFLNALKILTCILLEADAVLNQD